MPDKEMIREKAREDGEKLGAETGKTEDGNMHKNKACQLYKIAY